MSKYKKKKVIPMKVVQEKDGTWEVVTAFLGATVGNYLGPARGLPKPEAEKVMAKWQERLAGNERMLEMQRAGLQLTD